VEVISLHGHSGKVTTHESAELNIKYGTNMKSSYKVFRLDSHTRYTAMHREITLMTVSRYDTNQSVFTDILLQLCEIRMFLFCLYVRTYSVGNNTCSLNRMRGYDRVTQTYRMMQETLGNSITKWESVSDRSQNFYELISADSNEHPECPWTSRNDESVWQVHHFMWNERNL
jgi:hypothetical protein